MRLYDIYFQALANTKAKLGEFNGKFRGEINHKFRQIEQKF